MAVPNKTKQYLLAFGKVLVLAITFGYVIYRLWSNPDLDFTAFVNNILSKGATGSYFLLFFLFLATMNWVFEILKWKNLASTIQEMDFKTALKQSLASLTVSLATPNRIGEYGAKALFFERGERKKVLLLNFYSNAIQLATTVFFGLIGIIYFLSNYEVSYSYGALFLFGFLLVTIVGLMLLNMRFSGCMTLGSVPINQPRSVYPGCGLKSPISLLKIKPSLGEPNPDP